MEQSNLDNFNPDELMDQITVQHACSQLEKLMEDESFWKVTYMKIRYSAYVHKSAIEQGFSEDHAFDLACCMTNNMFTP